MDRLNWNLFLLQYRQTVDELCLKFTNIKKEYLTNSQNSPIESVYGRVKNVSSILDKANKKNIDYDKIEEKIEDIAGIRIICRFVEDIDKVRDLIRVRSNFDIKIVDERDYITNKKPSGYRSFHMLIKYNLFTQNGPKQVSAEIQIRTLAMDFWATIEHSLNYKYNGNMPEILKQRLVTTAEAAFRLDTEMSTIREEIMEAQKIMQVKSDIVDEILKNIQSLYFATKLSEANELNIEFIEIYQEDSLDKLMEFSTKLETIARLYKV